MNRGVIYINRVGLTVFTPILPRLLSIPFPADGVKDLDVISEEKLHVVLETAFMSSKIVSPHSFLLLLSDDTLFMRDFPSSVPVIPHENKPVGTPAQVQNQPAAKAADIVNQKNFLHEQDLAIQAFIDRVPFDLVSSKIITTDASRRVIVANKDLFVSIKNFLTKKGMSVEGVAPLIVFQKLLNVAAGFSPDMARSVQGHSDIIRQNDLLSDSTGFKHTVVDAKTGKERPTNIRAMILIGVFALLFLFMILLYYFLYIKPQPEEKVPKKVKKVIPTSKVSPAPTTSTSSFSAELSQINVKIQTSASTASQSGRLRALLTPLGITKITTSTSASTPARTLVLFSPGISQIIKEQIFAEVKSISEAASSQDSGTEPNTVSVIIGR